MTDEFDIFKNEIKELPRGWFWSVLEKVSDVVAGNPAPQDEKFFMNGTYPFVRVQDLGRLGSQKQLFKTNDYINDKAIKKLKLFPKGAVLFTKSGASTLLNQRAILGSEMYVVSHIAAAIPREGILNDWLYYWLKTVDFNHIAHATTLPSLPLSKARGIPVPIAPLNEQTRIVAEIEKQFSRLDEAVENLKRVKANLKRYKAAVLKAAVEGRLTEEWRKSHPDVEPADQLLDRILAERRKKWEESELAVMKTKGKTPKDDQWKKRYKEAELPKIEFTFEIPSTWTWSNLGHFSWSVKDGPHYSPKYSETGIPFISGGNIRPEGIDFSSAKYISIELHEKLSERCKPEPGDLLYTKGGTTGIARINTETRNFNVWVHVAVLKLVDSIYPTYLQDALNSPHCYRQSQLYTHGVGNQDLGLTRMIWITIPLPPLAEQQIIVNEIEKRFSIAERIETSIDQNLARADRLRQSILKKAFSGRLATRENTEESAPGRSVARGI